MELARSGLDVERIALALGAMVLLAAALTAFLIHGVGMDLSPMLLHGGAPIPVPPSGNPVPEGYWWEFSNSDPLFIFR